VLSLLGENLCFNRLWALPVPLAVARLIVQAYQHSFTTIMPFPILSIDLPDSIPMLNKRVKNWLMFAAPFEDEMRARGIWGHFDGLAYRPCDADAEGIRSVWEKTERNARYLLSEWLANSTYLRMRTLDSVTKMWEALEKETRPVLHSLGDTLLLHRVRSQGKRISVQRDPPVMTHLP
jgi:hypothetical protein